MREADVIKRTLQNTKKMGVKHIRMTFRPGVNVGVPDFLFLIPGGRPLFIEFKAPGKKPTPRQAYAIRELINAGYDVEVCDCPRQAIDAVGRRVDAARLSAKSE